MKNSRFVQPKNRTFVLYALSVVLVVLAAFAASTIAEASDSNNNPFEDHGKARMVRASQTDDGGYRLTRRILETDGLDQDLLPGAEFWPAATCYTYAGPTCPMVVAVPPGSTCTCYIPGFPPMPGTAY